MSRGILSRVNLWWILVSSTLLANVSSVNAHSCHEVKTAFQLHHIGPLKWVPETPGTDVQLQICQHSGPTCCTRKMEESYRVAVQAETLQSIASYSYDVKYLLTSHATAFQDTLQSVVSFSKSHVSSLFDSSYPALASDASGPVGELFSDLSLFIRGGNATVESAVHRFYDGLFPAVYRRLLRPGTAEPSAERDDCLRMTRQDVNPFGPHPGELAQELARALQAGRALSRALGAGEEAMDAVERAGLSRECARALVRMQYCSHCRGLTLIKPCVGYCLNVMRGCLAGLSELDRPWRRYFAVLQDAGGSMAGAHDLELALLGVRSQVARAVEYALLHRPRLVATVDKVCGQPTGTDTTVSPTPDTATSPAISAAPSLPPTQAPLGRLAHLRSSLPLKSSKKDEPEGLKKISRELLRYIQNYKSFFSSLPDLLCEGEMVVDDFTCWSGDDVVETLSYSTRVVDSGLQAQRQNPEVKVRSIDAVLTEAKEMLERFNQEMEDSSPGWGTRGALMEAGSGVAEGSADCDDEDGCRGSGEGNVETAREEQIVSSKGVSQEQEPPRRSTPNPPRQLIPNAKGSAPATCMAPPALVLLLLLLLSTLGSQWTLL
ncbi:glypican-5-like isoform X1 [Anguilla anguilla]|uniref:glypican-5-like isoform X1 n=1 Tax=Anguilla anguilla TaxID=7936 RepID=UPI0015B0CD0E|nr:glypican-5-like isoform X1 [Anguilla anguilla]